MWEEKLNNLQNWYKGCIIKNEDHLDIYEYFGLNELKGNVLEIGAGHPKGHWLIDKLDNYTGVDPVPHDKRIIKGIGEDLPFANKAFNNVICISTLQHCHDPVDVIHEMRRVCNGSVFITIFCSEVNSLIGHSFDEHSGMKLIERCFKIKKHTFYNQVLYVVAK